MTEDTEKAVKPGVTGTSCYEASLEAIKDTEYLPYNYTGIGHGVGLFVHELPNIGARCDNLYPRLGRRANRRPGYRYRRGI